MQEKNYTVRDPLGLHARPAGLLVKAAKGFFCESTLTVGASGKSASLKKLFALLALEVHAGDTVTLRTDGEDEKHALDTIGAVLEEKLC